MNPWAALRGEITPPEASGLPSRKHVLADEIDHKTMQPASKPGPKPPAPIVVAPAPRVPAAPEAPALANASIPEGPTSSSKREAPRKRTPTATPGPRAYRVPAPPPKPAMTYAQAIALRERHRNRQPVQAADLLEANRVVQETRNRAMPPQESYQSVADITAATAKAWDRLRETE